MEEDRRLAMFGWTLETLNMIVLPMVYNKLVSLNHISLYTTPPIGTKSGGKEAHETVRFC